MNDKQILEQFISRELNNLAGQINPAFRMFVPTATTYIMSFLDPYIDAFMSPDEKKINTKAATGYLKEETTRKIEDFMRRFEAESDKK